MFGKAEPYGVKVTNLEGHSTIYTYAKAATAKTALAGMEKFASKYQALKYMGRNW
jgi:hypothetical protein